MYNPDHFRVQDRLDVYDLIDRFPLSTLVTNRNGELDANQIPLLRVDDVDGGISLVGHVSRNNKLWKEATAQERVLVVFKGPDGYVSPNWYPGKNEAENYVPTWNYQVANLKGILEVVDDNKFVRGIVARLVKKFESSQTLPWKMSDGEPEFIKGKISAIVGIRIRVTDIEAKFKLSQNMSDNDREGAIEGIKATGNLGLYKAMQKQKLD